jgi:polysaccharide export outer membrane protein
MRSYKESLYIYIVIVTTLIALFSSVAFGDDYLIGEGDVLRVSVWGNDKLSLSVKVRPDGKISIPALGDVEAAGLTPDKLGKKLSTRMKKLERNPIVTIIIEEINNNKVYVFGGGVKPGVYDLNQRTTLLQLLCRIGNAEGTDLTEIPDAFQKADLKSARLIRDKKIIKNDFYKLFIIGDVREDILIKPDDTIYIPEIENRNIYVVGAVNEPKYIPYREGINVMEAILEAGGFTKFARKNSTIILRKNGSKNEEIDVKIGDLLYDGDLKENVRLMPGDYIVIREGIF